MIEKEVTSDKNPDSVNNYLSNYRRRAKLLFSLIAIGLVLFLTGSAALPFKDKILDTFYPKKQSKAAGIPLNPQYLIINKVPTGGSNDCKDGTSSADYCYPFYGYVDSSQEKISDSLDEIINELGTTIDGVVTTGTANRRLAVAYTINYFLEENGAPLAVQFLDRLLKVSSEKKLPVVINLDGWQFRMGRPDLWKWWDPGISAEESKQRKDAVEWTGWDNSSAIKLSWEQFDFTKPEFRLPPQPNLASERVINANKEQLQVLVPIIVNWYNSLPDDQKYLLAGVKVGWEVRVVNSYYPNTGLAFEKMEYDSIPRGNPIQTGYAGVKTAGIKSSGNITFEDLNTVMQRYFEELAKLTVDLGIPRGKVFTHGFAPEFTSLFDTSTLKYTTGLTYNTAQGAVVPHAQPGWSIYEHSKDVENAYGIDSSLNLIGYPQANAPWAASEWLCTGSNVTAPCSKDQWINAINNTFNYKNNRWINIYNWDGDREGVKDKPEALAGIKAALNTPVANLVDQPVLNPPAFNGRSVTLSWRPGQDNQSFTLLASSSPDLNSKGIFNNLDRLNLPPTTSTSYTINAPMAGKYYWQVVADGYGQRVISDIKTFTIDASGACSVTPVTDASSRTVINTDRVIFSWKNGQNNDSNYIRLSQSIGGAEIFRADVTNRTTYEIALPPNAIYFWNIESTGCGGAQKQLSPPISYTTAAPVDLYAPIGIMESADGSGCATITGWVCDQDSNNSQLNVILLDKGTGEYVAEALANRVDVHPEQAVKDACMDSNGRPSTTAHGYTFATPNELKDGRSHEIQAYSQNLDNAAKLQSTYKPLPGDSITINCSAPVSPAPTTNKININTSVKVQDKVQAY